MFPEVPEHNGRRLVPQLGIGCFFFTLIGLAATWGIATFVTARMKANPVHNSPYSREVQSRS